MGNLKTTSPVPTQQKAAQPLCLEKERIDLTVRMHQDCPKQPNWNHSGHPKGTNSICVYDANNRLNPA